MKRLALAVLLLSLPIAASSQAPVRVDKATLFLAFDLDGEAADADQIVTAANGDLTDAKTFTITANPDVCRLVDMTVTDANSSISAGVLTVVGTGCLDEARTCSFTFAAGGSGVKTLTCTDGQGAYFKTVTSVTTGTLTGEGGAGVDFMTLGYTSNSAKGWPLLGVLKPTGPNGERGVNPWGFLEIHKLVTTSGSASTTLTDVNGADDAFELVNVGDVLYITVSGVSYERAVTAKASADSITLNQSITVPTTGVPFKFKKLYFSTNPADDMSFGVNGYQTLNLNWGVAANVDVGGVVTSLECTYDATTNPGAQWTELNTTTVASAATQATTTESVNLNALPYRRCRFGLSFGTGDDIDTNPEDISAAIVLMK